jgi:hypothetical protein
LIALPLALREQERRPLCALGAHASPKAADMQRDRDRVFCSSPEGKRAENANAKNNTPE